MKYQQQVNSLPGALGPTTEAYWLNTTTTTGNNHNNKAALDIFTFSNLPTST